MKKTETDIVIIGLGETGYSCVEYFVEKGIDITVLDTRTHPPKLEDFNKQYSHIPLYLGEFPKNVLEHIKTLVISPGFSIDHPAFQNALSKKVEVIGDIEIFAKVNSAPVIAITGSNGKSTVTTLVGEMAKAAGIRTNVGGNLGQPALSLLKNQPECVVLELSSFQLETTHSLKTQVSTILNICPDHLDRYPNMEAYIAAKQRIFQNTDQIVVNRKDSGLIHGVPGIEELRCLSFGLDALPEEEAFGLITQDHEPWLSKGLEPLIPVSSLKLFGRHNVENALAALAIGFAAGFSMDAMLKVLKTFKGLPHRCEWVCEADGVQWINDSKGTNVGATVAAIQGLATDIPGKWVLIAGGLGKNADFSPLIPLVKDHCRAVILIGEAANELKMLLSPVCLCLNANDMPEAVMLAKEQTKVGDGVLLSPACASWDMFRNFEERGNIFKNAVLCK